MAFGLTAADYVVFGVYLLAVLAVGTWAARGQRNSDDFLAAGRRIAWAPLGLSLAVAGPAALFYCTIPGEAYTAGLKLLLVPALVWVAVPVVFWCLVPLYYNLDPDSVYEYLELRFSPAARTAAAGMFLLWHLLWLACVLCLPPKALHLGTAGSPPAILIVLAVGLTTTVYTLFGGMKATVWTDALQWLVMVAGLLVVVVAVRAPFASDVGRIWDTAQELGRGTVLDTSWDWSSTWSIWAAAPMLVLLVLFFFTADQATAGRLLAAGHYRDMNRSVLLGAVLFCLIIPVLVYAGLGLLAVYHVDAQEEMRPNWVVHSATDPETGRPLVDSRTVIDGHSIRGLLADKAILDPNTGRPLRDIERVVDADGRVLIDRLATWDSRPHPDRPRKRIWERRLRRGRDELLGWFVHRHVRAGLAGLVLAGLAAAVMAVVDSGLTAMAGVLVVDFHRRRGWAETWLARRCRKSPDELDEADQLRLARPLVAVLGILVTLLALAALEIGDLLGFMVLLVSLFGGPLLGVFLLGLFTRRTTAPAALGALGAGTFVSLWLVLGHYLAGTAALGWAWPWAAPLGIFWPLPLGTACTVVIGYGLSYFVGRRKNRTELTGLVAGLGTWGVIPEADGQEQVVPPGAQDEVYWIDSEEDGEKGPWR